ncbi:pentatricopeptide repeat-containing protein At1g80270, mitochondrial-like [Cornus florida]|uniref:pentatricopeptide repeat-containing protein At1g80270, mitochondrial-like n=1 Tax=Cornus florida TaxID=4283 RepID=UPI002896AE74|nr:pentatricopeptide repeat-containing protein At1g80270, mitochondrial-like [Cornus florida]
MWALRRASNPLKNRGFSIGTSQAGFTNLEITVCNLDNKVGIGELPQVKANRSLFLKRFYNTAYDSPKFFLGRFSFSSQAGAKSSGEEDDDLEDGFSELETSASGEAIQNKNAEDENEDELLSEAELFGEDGDGNGELLDSETDVTQKKSPRKKERVQSSMLKAILDAPGLSVHNALDKWVEEANLTRAEVWLAMLNLRKRRMYGRALQLSEWLESTKRLDFVERDYASRLDLIAKARGLQKAENYIEKIPESFRGELMYRTLLANCVVANNVKKAEEIFNKMKDLEFPVTSFSCNQLLLLYKRFDKKKIADVLLLMEKEDVKPTLFTYKILIDTKGLSNDITGMEEIVETMKSEGLEPDINIQSILARHYISGGLKVKAEALLKEMEGGSLKENRLACRSLLPLYAALGKADEVGRVWKFCESNLRPDECMAAIEAWGKLKKIEEAEAVFDKMSKTWKKLSSRQYSALMKVYANNKMLVKGKDLVKQMADNGCRIGPLTWDALVKLYVEAGEVEKADSILQKAAQQNQKNPLFSSYMAVMDHYAKRGDIHNSEKMLHRMKQSGYVGRPRQYLVLIQAYINAKAPAYGIRERMKADNVYANRTFTGLLSQVDGFRKNSVSELLD